MANITLYELGHYNNARLVPHTFGLGEIDSQEALHKAMHDWLQTLTKQTDEPCEEWIVCDYEDNPSGYVGEHDIDPHYWDYRQALEGSYLDAEVFEATT